MAKRLVSMPIGLPGADLSHRVPELDGLRALAIGLVFLGHFAEFSLGRGGVWGRFAAAGVLLFFVLSGFLITALLCAEDRGAAAGVSLRRFYVRRALRLLPASLLLIFSVATLKLFGWVTDENWIGVAASLLYVRNIFGTGTTLGHLWSLSLEEQFYFVWPLLFVLVPRGRIFIAVSVVLLIVTLRAAGIAFGLQDVQSGVFYIRPWFRFDSIMVGCVLALLRDRNPSLFLNPPAWFVRLTHPLCGFGLLGLWMYLEGFAALSPWCLTLQTVACVFIVAGLLAHGCKSFTQLLSLAPLTLVGRMSYSLYLWQQLFVVTKSPDWGWLRRPGVDLVAAIVCATISWRFVERRFLRLRHLVH